MIEFSEQLKRKIKVFNETIWEGKITEPKIERWLKNFKGKVGNTKDERLHALYLLSQFMYFGEREIRELLKALYRDLFKYPIINEIRKSNNNTTNFKIINEKFNKELNDTRFLGIGNPSESGTHLLYLFRQENFLNKELFINSYQIFNRVGNRKKVTVRDNNIKRYVFIDDLCSSGTQAYLYSKDLLGDLKNLKPDVSVMYYTLFGLKEGIENVRKTKFDKVETIFLLDDSFKCFNNNSRHFLEENESINRDFAKKISIEYGKELFSNFPLGYKNNQLLLGFHHNIPDNTLPIIWVKKIGEKAWEPIFRRYDKLY